MKKIDFITRMSFLSLLCAVALLLSGSVAVAATDLTVVLPSAIEARDGAFYLGEYASFEGAQEMVDSASMALIEPKDGRFTRNDVIEALASTKAAGRAVAIRMPESVAVMPESRIVEELRQISGWKWRIDAAGLAVDERTAFSLPPRVSPGAKIVAVKVHDEDGSRTNRQVSVRWFQPVVYSTAPLSRNEALDASRLAMRIDEIGMHENLVWSAAQLKGAVPRQAVAAYRAISMGDMEKVRAVKNGSTVTLIASVNGLGIEVQGVALQRGGIGDVIKVKNLASKKVIEGTVVDVGRVAIR